MHYIEITVNVNDADILSRCKVKIFFQKKGILATELCLLRHIL